MKNIERNYEINFAIEKIKKTMLEMNIDYEIEEYLTNNNEIKTIFVKSNNITGSGKGIKNQSIASGLFELLEHFVFENKLYENKIKLTNFDKLKKIFRYNNSIEYFFFEKKENEQYFSLKFKEYRGEDFFYLPEILVYLYGNDEYLEFKKTKLYSSNNGIAIGMDKDEAILHSLNELIERNSLSEHYIDVFMKCDTRPMKIKKDTLSKKIKKILFSVEEVISEELEILKIKNEFDLYVYLVFPKNKKLRKFYKGSGCSLLSEYALERAILECLQSYHLLDINEQQKILNKEKLYKDYKLNKYLDIYRLNYNDDMYENIDFEENKLNNDSIKEILEIIINRLYDKGYKLFISKLFEKNNIICIKCIIPNFESFHLVAEGVAVVPNIYNYNKIIKSKETKYDKN